MTFCPDSQAHSHSEPDGGESKLSVSPLTLHRVHYLGLVDSAIFCPVELFSQHLIIDAVVSPKDASKDTRNT